MLRIREQSAACGIKTSVIQKALDISAAYWSQVTHYRGVLSEEKLRILAELLDFDRDEQKELFNLRAVARQRGWWNEYSGVFDDELMRFYGLEDGAVSIRSVDSCVVPGLLQTEDYVRALISAIVATGRPTEAQQRVRARLRRQQRLDDPDPLHLSVIVGQTALMQEVGGPDVLRQQLLHLIRMVESHPDNLDLRVVPFNAAGSVAGVNAATFHILDFESPPLPALGWLESAIYGEATDNRQKVEALDFLYNQLRTIALSREESVELISHLANR